MNNFDFVTGSVELLDFVEPLWNKLNKHHQANSNYFKSRFEKNKFEDRKNKFLSNNNLDVKIDLIKDKTSGLYIGYCISTINKELIGEIDSLFIEKEYRKFGLGDKLMTRAIEWLDNGHVKIKIITVAEGNENVLDFYKRHGFYKMRTTLQQVDE